MLSYSLVVLALSAAGVRLVQEPELVRAARMVSVPSLDSTLPAIPLERWLLQQAGGTRGKIEWEVKGLPAWSAYVRRDPRRQVFVAESSFAASMAQRDLKAFAAFVSPEAVFFADTAVLRGRDRVVEGWRRFFAGPAPFSWKPDVIEVPPSGKLAISNGPVFDPSGNKVGNFSSIWRQESDGRWLIIFDKSCS